MCGLLLDKYGRELYVAKSEITDDGVSLEGCKPKAVDTKKAWAEENHEVIDSGRALMRLAGPDAGRGAVASPLGHPSIVTSVQDADSVITARRSQSGRL